MQPLTKPINFEALISLLLVKVGSIAISNATFHCESYIYIHRMVGEMPSFCTFKRNDRHIYQATEDFMQVIKQNEKNITIKP